MRRLFDQASARAEVVSCSLNASASEAAGTDVITVTWRLSGGVNIGGLQIKPYLVYTDLQVPNENNEKDALSQMAFLGVSGHVGLRNAL